MVRIILILLSLCVVLSCKNYGNKKIGFFLPHVGSERYKKEKAYLNAKLTEAGYEMDFYEAGNDQLKQFDQVDSCLEKGVKILILDAVNVNLAAKIVREAHSRGAIVIAYDRLIKNAEVDYYISFRYEAIGEELANFVIKQNTSNIIYVGGDRTDNNALLIDSGVFKIINPFIKENKIHVLYKIYIEEWSAELAYREVNFFLNLSNQEPDAVLSLSDKMNQGILRSLREHNLAGKVILTGMDAEKSSCRNIISGNQSMTMYKPVKQLAAKAAEIAIKIAENKKIDEATEKFWNGKVEIPSILINPIVVGKENMKSTVIADGFQQENEIYQ